MKLGLYCVVEPMIPAVTKHHVVPPEDILDDGFGNDNLPYPSLCWIRDVNYHFEGMNPRHQGKISVFEG